MYSGTLSIYGNPNGPHYYELAGNIIDMPPTPEIKIGLQEQSFYKTMKLNNLHTAQVANEILDTGDAVYGKTLGMISGIKWQTRPREEGDPIRANLPHSQCAQMLDPSIFGIEKIHTKTASSLESAADAKLTELLTHNIQELRTSIASTAMAMYTGEFVNTVLENPVTGEEEFFPDFSTLNSRWREMAKAAVHGGPIACLRGGSPDAVEVDIRGAYLHALAGEMPVCGRRYEDPLTGEMKDPSYFAGGPNFTWNDIINNNLEHGFVDATVYVREDLKYGLPPLPVSNREGMIFPRGRFRGVWTLPLLKMAVDFGEAIVEEVHHCFFPRMVQNTFAPFAEELKRFPKHISKELYTKFWGKFNQSGGFNATKVNPSYIRYAPRFEVLECPDYYAHMLTADHATGGWYIDYRKGNDPYNNHIETIRRMRNMQDRGISIDEITGSGNWGNATDLTVESLKQKYPNAKPFPRLIESGPSSTITTESSENYERFLRDNPTVRQPIPKDGFIWFSAEIEQLQESPFRKYRPDLAAYISSYNIMNVYKGLRQLKPESIIATHVDAIWTDDIEGAQRLCDTSDKDQWLDTDDNQMYTVSDYGGWNIKRRGDLQFLACGVYIHKGPKLKLNGKKAFKERTRLNENGEEIVERVYENRKIGCSGYDSNVFGTVNEKSLKTWIQRTKNRQASENSQTRLWEDSKGNIVFDNPKIRPEHNKNAMSQSIILNQVSTVTPFGGIDFFSPDWTRNGDHSTQVQRWREIARQRREREAERARANQEALEAQERINQGGE
jgi:hypothetical protein